MPVLFEDIAIHFDFRIWQPELVLAVLTCVAGFCCWSKGKRTVLCGMILFLCKEEKCQACVAGFCSWSKGNRTSLWGIILFLCKKEKGQHCVA